MTKYQRWCKKHGYNFREEKAHSQKQLTGSLTKKLFRQAEERVLRVLAGDPFHWLSVSAFQEIKDGSSAMAVEMLWLVKRRASSVFRFKRA